MSRTVYVDIYNRIAVLQRPYPEEDLLKYWSYTVPHFRFMRGYYPGWNGRKKMLVRDRISSPLFFATRKEIEAETDIRFSVRKLFEGMPHFHARRQLRSDGKYAFQNDCADAMVEKGNRYGGGLILNATATGKTRIAAMYFAQMFDYGLFVVDQIDLLEQAKAEIEDHMHETIGYVGNQKFKPKRITVATAQTMVKHSRYNDSKFGNWTKRIKTTIVDEIHAQISRRTFSIVTDINPPVCFGLTATLSMGRKDVRLRACAIAGPVIYEYPVTKGMEAGVLSHGSVVRVIFQNNTRLFTL